MKISEVVKKIVSDYRETSIEILPGLTRNQYETIKKIYFYRHDKFVECSDDKAIFWQVVSPYIPHFAKLIDLDPKDLRPKGEGDVNFYQAWILRRKFQGWVEDNNFSVDIDDLTKLMSSFGSFVWKVTKKGGKSVVEPCDLRNLAFDATSKTIREASLVELHYLSDSEIRDKGWKNKDKIVKNAVIDQKTGKKEIWEFWGNYEYKDGKFKYYHAIGAGYGDKETIAFDEDTEKDESPYYDFHLYEYDGMWLRKGAYETCFPEQHRANTLVNENAQATAIASLLLLKSEDPNTQGNVLHQAISGQIITSKDLQQIGIDNRAYTTLLNELEKIERQVQKKLMLPDIATGDNLPAGTPFRGMALMSNAYKSAFKQIRARIASGIVDVLLGRIFPELVKDWNRGSILEIAESVDDIKIYDKAIKNLVRARMYADANARGEMVTPEMEMSLEQAVDDSIRINGRKVETSKGFFDFKYGITLDPVGETYDKAQQNDAIIQALTLVMQNPAITDIPAYKQLLENNGITPFKITKEEQKQMMDTVNPQEPKPKMLSQMLQSQADTA